MANRPVFVVWLHEAEISNFERLYVAIHVHSSATEAEKMMAVVVHPKSFATGRFVLFPMMLRLLVMRTINNINGGVERPWTMPAKTRALMGLTPKKFIAAAAAIIAAMAP